VERCPAVLALEVVELLGVDEDDVVADPQRRRRLLPELVGQDRLLAVQNGDLRVV